MLKPSYLSRNIFYKKLSAEILIIFEFWLDWFLKVPELLDSFLHRFKNLMKGDLYFLKNIGGKPVSAVKGFGFNLNH